MGGGGRLGHYSGPCLLVPVLSAVAGPRELESRVSAGSGHQGPGGRGLQQRACALRASVITAPGIRQEDHKFQVGLGRLCQGGGEKARVSSGGWFSTSAQSLPFQASCRLAMPSMFDMSLGQWFLVFWR